MRSIRLQVNGEWRDVEEPTLYELRVFQDGVTWLPDERRAELAAWLEMKRQQASRLTPLDRRFLRAMRIEPWENEPA